MNEPATPFDQSAVQYDAWYDTPTGRVVWEAEVDCLRPLLTPAPHPWLEVGVGTGRFAAALHIDEGIDPSAPMLALAARRGISVRVGLGEALPYPDGSFGAVVLVTTLCFVSQPALVLAEARRVLRAGGRLVVGFVPRDGPWGQEHARKAREGHPIYREAHFHTIAEVCALATAARLVPAGARCTLFASPGEALRAEQPRDGVAPGAGFVALAFERETVMTESEE